MDVSIVIVSWNTRDVLRDCLRSLHERAGDAALETIVVDNHSADGSAEMIAAEFPAVRLIRNDDNRGFAAANNQGIAVAHGRYVLLLNSDTLIHDAAIEKAVEFADAHPDAGIVGCQTRGRRGNLQYNCYLFPSLLNVALSLTRLQQLFWSHRFFNRARFGWWDYQSEREVDAVAGCFMLARREAIQQVGPMSEEYFMYSEDTDWCLRMRRAGWKTMYTPKAVITHLGRCSSSQAPMDMHLLERRSLLMFLERKSGRATRAAANLMFCIASLLRVPLVGMKRLSAGRSEGVVRQWELAVAVLRFHLFGRLPTSIASVGTSRPGAGRTPCVESSP
ncbi:MAG: glycosyltransferase family 2 protein [Planctomycetota bacterium]